jgi:hypothetical protein
VGWETVREYAVLFVPLLALWLALLVAALRDLIRRRPEELAGGNKALWYGIVVLVATFGPIIYFAFGRRRDT